MAPSSSNLQSSTNASEPSTSKPVVRDDQAVKTFAFDATAGRQARAEDAELPIQTAPRPKYLSHLPLEALLRRAAGELGNSEAVPATDAGEYAALPVATELISDQQHPWRIPSFAEQRWRRSRRRPAWLMVSLGLHVAIFIALGFCTLAVMKQPEDLDLYSSAYAPVELEEFPELEIQPAEKLETDFQNVGLASLEELSSEILLNEVSLDAPNLLGEASLVSDASDGAVASLSELDQLFGADGIGMADLETGAGATTVSFFGTKVKAKRILYMLDNSGGMRHGGKFEALISELRKSVDALEVKQEFYVIFYSDTVYPLYYPNSSQRFVSATEKNRQQLERWLDSVEFCVGNAIDEALAATAVIRPDVVFLLTDGDLFTTEKKKGLLLDRGQRPYPIYTFGLGVSENSKTAAGLEQVAKINGGTFQAIEVSKADQDIADRKQRLYHNKQPGAVWGKKVGVRKW